MQQHQDHRATPSSVTDSLYINPSQDAGPSSHYNEPSISGRDMRFTHEVDVENNNNNQFNPSPSDPGIVDARYERSIYGQCNPGPSGTSSLMGRSASYDDRDSFDQRRGLGASSSMTGDHMYGAGGPIAFVVRIRYLKMIN